MTRNIEDLRAARISPVISDQVQYPISMEALTSPIQESQVSIKSFMFRYNQSAFSIQINNIVSPQSRSSEVHVTEQARPLVKSKVALIEKKYTAKILGLKGSVIMATKNAAFIRDIPLYRLVGNHYLVISIKPGKQCKNLFYNMFWIPSVTTHFNNLII